MQKIIPTIWFDNNADEAFKFYTKVFPDSHIQASSPFVTEAVLSGVTFTGINGGPIYRPNPAISYMVISESKEETDTIWHELSAEGKILMPLDTYPWSEYYGWVMDKYDISWQIYFGKLSDVHQQRIVPTLMFCGEQQGKCQTAIDFYADLFQDFRSDGILKYPEGEIEGQIQHTQFTVKDFVLMAMDSGIPQPFTFTEGNSLVVLCEDQEEIDYFWNIITQEGSESMCGWCKDAFGVSWQIIPKNMATYMSKPDAVSALMKMKKINIQELENV